MKSILDIIGETGLIPVVVIDEAKDAIPTANALLAGGIGVIEITMRTEAGLDAIKAISGSCPEMLVGAGTVLTLGQAKQCVDAGARFIVSPGLNRDQAEWCRKNNVALIPGCVTPTEIMSAAEMGINVLKFFPANIYGGLEAIKALAAPFGVLKFVPTGGVNERNLGEYAASPLVHAVGGSWVCNRADIAKGNFENITRLCREAVQVLRNGTT